MTDWLRWANVVLAMIAVALLVTGSIARWSVMPKRIRRIVPWVIATYVVLAYGSGEAARQDTPAGVRVAMTTCVLLGLIVALMFRIGDDDYDR